MKAHFITFANSDSNFSFDRIRFEAHEMNVFSTISCYTEKDFDSEYVEKFGSHFIDYKRGYGYWAWKPYLIKKKFSEIEDGDIVVYADCGCMLLYENRNTLLQWIKIVMESESGILSPCYGPYLERQWTRMDLYDYINKTYNKDNIDIFENAVQCGAGILVLCKNNKSQEFVDIWNDIMSNHFHLCTDEPSSIPNHKEFRENRHDQSVFSMLSKIYKIETIETKDGILNKYTSPIIASRCKNDKSTWKKPIKILFDSQIYDLQEFGGISRMYADLSKEFNRNEIVDNYTGSGVARGGYQDFFAKFSVSKTKNFYLSKLKPYLYDDEKNRELSEKMISQGDYDILYPTFFSTYFLKHLNGKPFVMSVHDMIPELYPQYFRETDMQIVGKREMVKHASAIEVPTECTKKDLIRILGVDENKIHVVGRALNPDFGNKWYSKSIVNFKYILYVGQRNTYKRFDWFIKHITPFLENHKDINIICTGKEFKKSELDLISKYGLNNRVFTIFADDITMATLYKFAEFFVFPSEYEGFGLPVLESYKMGCIALLNDIEVFREITDGLGTFFKMTENESNLSEIAERIYGLSDGEKKSVLKTQYAILKKHSFDDYINRFKKVFSDVLNKRPNSETLDLFICTHKDFEPPVKNPCYKIINAKDINNDTAENGLPGSFYSEFLIYFDVAKRKDLKDYIGFCHYRKYFSFMDNIPDMDDLFKECDIVTVDRITFRKNIKEQYAACHNVDDLEIVENIIREKFPEYADAADYTFNRCNKMFQCNMFIMKKNDFLDYIKFIKSVLDEYLNVVGMDINQRILDNKEKYLKNIKDKPQNSEIWYQYRIGGYLGERLTNVFIYGNRERFGKIKTYKLTETEEKYKKKDKEMKKLALIIPTKDNSESLLRLLYSIVYHTEYDKANLALYIVDNGSKENEKNKVIEHINRVIKEYGYNIKFYETDNYTLPQLYNFVVNEKVDTDTDLLLFCTDNVELTNDCISNLVNNWSEQCGTLGARLMLEDNTIQHIGYNIKKDNFTCYDVVQKQVLPAEYRNTKINVYGNSNSFMLTSVALWKQLNGFDEKYKSNFFDIDYSIKALLNGKNSYNITGAVCWYHKAIKSKYAKRDENRISKRIKEYLILLDETAKKE